MRRGKTLQKKNLISKVTVGLEMYTKELKKMKIIRVLLPMRNIKLLHGKKNN